MNKMFIIGNLTRDPETRNTQSGKTVCNFTVAVSRRFAGQSGEKEADFFRVNVWEKLGEVCEQYLAKGRKVAVVGELQARTYEGNDGVTRLSLEIRADEVEFLTPKNAQADSIQPDTTQPAAPDIDGFEAVADGELPF